MLHYPIKDTKAVLLSVELSLKNVSLRHPGHPSNPKRGWDTHRIPSAGTGRRHGADPASPRWQPGQHRDQLCHDGDHRPSDAGGAGTVDPRRPAGWGCGVHQHSTRRAPRQHYVRPNKQCGSGVARAHRGTDGAHSNRGDARRSADHERPDVRKSGSGRRRQTVAGDSERRQSGALRANHHHRFLLQLLPASRNHRRHRSSDPSDRRVRRRLRPLLRKLQLPQPPTANPSECFPLTPFINIAKLYKERQLFPDWRPGSCILYICSVEYLLAILLMIFAQYFHNIRPSN